MKLRGMRILLVDDVADVRDILAMLLRMEGADVVAVGSGRQAAAIVSRRDFDVVITDFGLPDVPGDVLITEILSMARSPLRVVVMTGYGEPYLTRALQRGADAVFTKPLELTSIVEYLQRRDVTASA